MTKFIHTRNKNIIISDEIVEQRNITFAYDIEENRIAVGFAIHCPKDTYVKKIGREVAIKMLEEKPIYISYLDMLLYLETLQKTAWEVTDSGSEYFEDISYENTPLDISSIPEKFAGMLSMVISRTIKNQNFENIPYVLVESCIKEMIVIQISGEIKIGLLRREDINAGFDELFGDLDEDEEDEEYKEYQLED